MSWGDTFNRHKATGMDANAAAFIADQGEPARKKKVEKEEAIHLLSAAIDLCIEMMNDNGLHLPHTVEKAREAQAFAGVSTAPIAHTFHQDQKTGETVRDEVEGNPAPESHLRVVAGVTVDVLLDQCERLAEPIRSSTKSFQYASALDNCVAVIKALRGTSPAPQTKHCPACGGTGRMGPFFPGGVSTVCGNCAALAAEGQRRTFTVPEGHEAILDADGRATGETRAIER